MPASVFRPGRPSLATIPRWIVTAMAVSTMILGCRRVDETETTRAAPSPPEQGEPADEPSAGGATVVLPDFARVAQELSPSVVSVISTVEDESQGAAPLRGLGSGMIVTAGGQILTNEHVIRDASSIDIELSNRQQVSAKTRYADPLLDLALLELTAPLPNLSPVQFEDRTPVPGTWVLAVGQPFALGHTVTVGVISGLRRDYVDLGRPAALRPNGIWSFIQTDASINIGNSGGPLANADGNVVGITTAVRSDGQGLAFAIPAPMAQRFLEEVWTHGRVRHARLGIRAEDAGPGVMPGRVSVVRVTEVEPGGPAAKAGLTPGDLILAINDEPVVRVSDVAYRTQLLGVGARMRLTIKRGDGPPQQILLIPAETTGNRSRDD